MKLAGYEVSRPARLLSNLVAGKFDNRMSHWEADKASGPSAAAIHSRSSGDALSSIRHQSEKDTRTRSLSASSSQVSASRRSRRAMPKHPRQPSLSSVRRHLQTKRSFLMALCLHAKRVAASGTGTFWADASHLGEGASLQPTTLVLVPNVARSCLRPRLDIAFSCNTSRYAWQRVMTRRDNRAQASAYSLGIQI